MAVERQQVVRFHYSVAEEGGAVIESSKTRGEPMAALLGAGNIIPGLEKALLGRESGDSFEVTVPSAEAYGERHPGLIQRIPKKHVPVGIPMVPGQTMVLNTQQGRRVATIVKVGMTVVDVDLNHPMAGKDLRFEIEIVDARAASPEELQHGHAHGDGGVHHD